jgi:hypothetical protein
VVSLHSERGVKKEEGRKVSERDGWFLLLQGRRLSEMRAPIMITGGGWKATASVCRIIF